ncbi:M48 family metalloprotease [Streptosporangium sp. NPDC004379]|uniref:M48 family metalloprotease n=1 Tax=Streptosporangium sp. NPDC004379 TaxID=3366189 RepID=UPI0036A6F602
MGTARLDPAGMTAGRVGPFLLPAATTSRFVLLIAVTLSATGFTWDLVAGGPSGWREAYLGCDRAAAAAARRLPAGPLAADYLRCVDDVGGGRMLGGVVAMAAVGCLIVALHAVRPRLTIGRQGLVPADPVRHADLHETVRRLAGAEGLRRVPRILIDANRKLPDGWAFGCYPRYHLRLNIGVLQAGREETRAREVAVPGEEHEGVGRGAVESVVLHELAHLRNRDVDLTGLTLAAVWVFPVAVAVPSLLFTLVHAPGRLLDTGLRMLIATALIAVLAAAVLRSREHYADVRAAAAGGGPVTRDRGRTGPLQRLLPMHPDDSRRAEVVRNPGILLRWAAGEALGAGIVTGLGLSHLQMIIGPGLGGDSRYALPVAALPYGLLTAAVVGAGAYRATLLTLLTGDRGPRGTLQGAALAAGILLGRLISPSPMRVSWAAAVVREPFAAAGTGAVLLLMCVAFTRWLPVAAAAWLPVARGRTWLPVLAGGVVPAASAFGPWLGAWVIASSVALETGDLPAGLYMLGAHLFDAALLTVLWVALLHPLGAWLRHRRPGRDIRPGAGEAMALPPVRIRPLLALAPAAAVLALGAVNGLLHLDRFLAGGLLRVGGTVRGDAFDVLLAQVAALLVLFWAVQFLVALVVAALTGGGGTGIGLAHGMLAALATGIAGTVLVAVLAFGATGRPAPPCVPGAPDCDPLVMLRGAGTVLLAVTAGGTAAGAVASLMAGGVRALVRRREARPGRPAAAWARRSASLIAAACAVAWAAVMVQVWLAETGRAPGLENRPLTSSASAVPPPGPPGTRDAGSACARVTAAEAVLFLGDDYYAAWAGAFARLAETDDPFLAKLGAAGHPAARDASARMSPLQRPVHEYCLRVPPG